MTKSIIKKIQKNLMLINIIIICSGALYFYLNKDKFDTYKTFINYSFQERLTISKNNEISIFNSGKVKYFLNDLDFNKKFYGINDLNFGDEVNTISIRIDHKEEKIEFSFVTKEKTFLSFINPRNNKEDLTKMNNEIVSKYIEECLIKFHTKLYANVSNMIKFRQEQLEELYMISESKSRDKSSYDLIDIEIKKALSSIDELYQFSKKNNKLIIVNDYSNKFRRLHLNTNEYEISFLILLLLVNFLIKNINKILN